VSRLLLDWCKRLHYEHLPVSEFGRKHVRAFLDDLRRRRDYRGRTINNYVDRLSSLWQELVKDEVLEQNPWLKIAPVRTEEKLRRMFSDDERRIVAAEVEHTDYWLFRGLLLQFFCYVRPVELCRMRFRDFDLGRGLVTVREDAAKGWRKVVKTIPASVLHYFMDGRFDKVPGNYYLFGRVGEGARAKMEPSPVQIDENRPYKRHARILKRLHDSGALPGDIAGLTWYSWKDTGISLHAAKTSPLSTRDQAGHIDFAVTSIYYHAPEQNQEYRVLENDLLM
jgi:integrase